MSPLRSLATIVALATALASCATTTPEATPAPRPTPAAASTPADLPEPCPTGLSATTARTVLRIRSGGGETLRLGAEEACIGEAVELVRRRLYALGAVVHEATAAGREGTVVVALPDELRPLLDEVLAVGAVTLHAVDEAAMASLPGLPEALADRGVWRQDWGDRSEIVADSRSALGDLDAHVPLAGGSRWVVAELADRDPTRTRYHALAVEAAAIGPEHIQRCSAEAEATDWGPQVNARLTPTGAEAMGALSERLVGQRLAIVMDGELMSAPVVMEKLGAAWSLTVEGMLGARVLAVVLREGPLPCPVRLRSRQVATTD